MQQSSFSQGLNKRVLITTLHHQSLTWNLKMMVCNRNLLFQGAIFRFHVKLQGCIQKKHGETGTRCRVFGWFDTKSSFGTFFSQKKQTNLHTTIPNITHTIQIWHIYLNDMNGWFLWYIYVGKIYPSIPWRKAVMGRVFQTSISQVRFGLSQDFHEMLFSRKLTYPGEKEHHL